MTICGGERSSNSQIAKAHILNVYFRYIQALVWMNFFGLASLLSLFGNEMLSTLPLGTSLSGPNQYIFKSFFDQPAADSWLKPDQDLTWRLESEYRE